MFLVTQAGPWLFRDFQEFRGGSKGRTASPIGERVLRFARAVGLGERSRQKDPVTPRRDSWRHTNPRVNYYGLVAHTPKLLHLGNVGGSDPA